MVYILTQSNSTGEGRKNSYDPGDLTWLLGCTALAWIMIPGVAFFYSGLGRQKSSLSLFLLCLSSCAVVSVQWWLIGFSLCLSKTGGPFIGNIDNAFLQNIGDSPYAGNERVPATLVGLFYGLFAAIAPTVFTGAVVERARFIPQVIFMFFWTTFVFDFLVYSSWNTHGWSNLHGTLDFGGGTPIHISTGSTALAYAIMVGKRKNRSENPPHSMLNVLLGTSFIWTGWILANAAAGLSPNLRTISTFYSTNLSASVGGITWALLDFIRHGRKWSPLGFCFGVISGLVAITPASGFVSPSSSVIFGLVGGIVCNFSLGLKHFLPMDDAFDVGLLHGVGAIAGNIMTGFFAEKSIAALDGMTIIKGGGLYDGNWKQILIQGVDTLVGIGWSFLVSLVMLWVINIIPGLHLRAAAEDELLGLDKAELGYSMYEYVDEIITELEHLKEKVNRLQSSPNGSIITVMTLPPIEEISKGSLIEDSKEKR